MAGERIEDLEDLQIFKETLSDDLLELHVLFIKKIEQLAKKIGPKLTREDLIPFIQEHYVEFHDETLLHLAEQLRNFIPLVGGLFHATPIFKLLGRLCVTDETIVREKAVECLTSVLQELNEQEAEEFVLPVIHTFIEDDWFTSKCSAVTLFPSLYLKIGEAKRADLRNTFKSLIQDDSPMVRKAAATACIKFVAVVEQEFVESEFVPIFRDISQDPMDSVTCVTVDIAIALFKRIDKTDLEDEIFLVIEQICDGNSTTTAKLRVALNMASCQDLLHARFRGRLLAMYEMLSNDPLDEVRVAAASNLFNYCCSLKRSYDRQPETSNNFEPVFDQSIMPILQRFEEDKEESVRLALSSNILPFASILSADCFKKNVVSLLLKVLEKQESIAIQARFLIGLGCLSEKIDLTQSLDAIKNSVRAVIVRSETNWRARRSILATFIDIAKFCSAEYFSVHFKVYYAALLGDTVYAIRRSASLILPLISKHYGIKWSCEHLVPFFTTFSRDTRYLYRFVSLFGINEMVHPHLCPEPGSFLGDWKKFVLDTEDKVALKAFAKVVKTSHLIQKELKEEKYTSILQLKEELGYISQTDTSLYSETDFDSLRLKYKTLNLYSVEEKDFTDGNWPYLQGILNLIYNKFLPIVDTLNQDSTENVQIGAICTLGEISDFIKRLNKEESEDWVQQTLKKLPAEEIAAILDEIHHEFKTAIFKDEDLDEPIDTTLIECDELDLTKTISIENSKKRDSTETGGNLSEEKPSLVKDLTLLDEKVNDKGSVQQEVNGKESSNLGSHEAQVTSSASTAELTSAQ